MKLQKIKGSDYGLTETKAKEISKMFKPMLDEMESLENDFNHVMALKQSSERSAEAKELRLRYVKVRTGTAAIHKDLKAFYLQGGRFVDGWKNAQLMASQGNEEKLMDIEKHFENIEKERIQKIAIERGDQITQVTHENDEVYLPADLGSMPDDVWANYYASIKATYDARVKAEEKAEEDKIEAERISKLYYERKDMIINEGLWDFLDDDLKSAGFGEFEEMIFNDLMNELRDMQEKKNQKQKKIEDENIRLKKEADKKQKEREAEFKKHTDNLEEERKARQKLQDKIDAEKKERKEAEQLKLKAGDKQKVQDLITDLNMIKNGYEFKYKKNQKMFADVYILLDKIIDHINK